MPELYSDPLVAISDDAIRVRAYSMLMNDKVVPWHDVESVRAVLPTLWNGRWKIWGTADLRTWLPLDVDRPSRETIFVMKLHSQWIKVGFTVHDSARVKQLLAERALLVDEQGDARPAPPPVETRPIWRWGVLYVVLLMVIGLAAQAAYFYPQLPERVATHFNFRGDADAWGSRGALIGAILGCSTFLATVFVSLAALLTRSPSAAVMGRWLLEVGVSTLALMLVLAHLTYRANLTPQPSIGWTLGLLVAYLIVLGAQIALLFRRLT